MSGSAIVMMLLAMAILWGGLALAIWNLTKRSSADPETVRRDL